MKTKVFKDVDEYIESFPKDVQTILTTVRRVVKKAVPGVEESISYNMPTYKFHGRLLYLAAYKAHYSIFAATKGVEQRFKKELARFEGTGRGTIRFPLEEPVPVKLISVIVKFRAKENLERTRKRQ